MLSLLLALYSDINLVGFRGYGVLGNHTQISHLQDKQPAYPLHYLFSTYTKQLRKQNGGGGGWGGGGGENLRQSSNQHVNTDQTESGKTF